MTQRAHCSRLPSIYCNILVCFLLLIHVDKSSCEIAEGSIRTQEEQTLMYEFGFLQGGTATVVINSLPSTANLHLMICSEEAAQLFTYRPDEICYMIGSEEMPCQVTQPFRGQLRLFYVIPKYDYYHINLVNCDVDNITANVSLTLMNPHNNHLSSIYIPAPAMFTVMAILWAIAAVIWTGHLLANWNKRVQILILALAFPVLKLIYAAYAVHYYNSKAETGNTDTLEWFIHWSTYIAYQTLFHLLLLLFATGWCIAKLALGTQKYQVITLSGGILILMMLQNLYALPGTITDLLVSLAMVTLRVTILVYIFVGCNTIIRTLEASVLTYNIDIENIESHYNTIKRRKLFMVLKIVLMVWLSLKTLAFVTNLMFFAGSDTNWIDMMNTEFLDFVLFACLAYNFRIRPGEEQLFVVHEPQEEDTEDREADEQEIDDQDENTIEMAPFYPSRAEPDVSRSAPSNAPVLQKDPGSAILSGLDAGLEAAEKSTGSLIAPEEEDEEVELIVSRHRSEFV